MDGEEGGLGVRCAHFASTDGISVPLNLVWAAAGPASGGAPPGGERIGRLQFGPWRAACGRARWNRSGRLQPEVKRVVRGDRARRGGWSVAVLAKPSFSITPSERVVENSRFGRLS